MGVSAKVILDSTVRIGPIWGGLNVPDVRGISVQMRYPKFIHGEMLTHRKKSRNASSSRAIPVDRVIQDVLDDPAMPAKWFKNKAGMQGTEEITGAERDELIAIYLESRDDAVRRARQMQKIDAHKQHINRVLEPFCHINTIYTATNWTNFLALRKHHMADPTINALAIEVYNAIKASKTEILMPDEWHLPYVTEEDRDQACGGKLGNGVEYWQKLLKVSTARCASVSYKTVDGKVMTFEKAEKLHDDLVVAEPLHASPAEHQFKADVWSLRHGWENPELGGNLGPGVIQYRKTLANEFVSTHEVFAI